MAGDPRVGIDALSSVHEITAEIVSSLDLDQTLATIARAMAQILAADIGAIYLVDEAAGVLRLRGVHGERSPSWAGQTMPLDRGMNAAAARTGRVQRVDDYLTFPTDARVQSSIVTEEPMRSVITAPMTHRGRRLGSMGAVRREVRPFTDNDVVLLQTLADHATIAVANALAYEELAGAQQQLREAHGLGLKVLLEVSAHLPAAGDLPTFFGRLSRTIADLVGARRAVFLGYDREHGLLRAQPEAFGFGPDILDRLDTAVDPRGQALADRILFGDVVFRGELSRHNADLAPYWERFAAIGVSSGIAVCWRAGEDRMGILTVADSMRPGGFTEGDVLVLQTAGFAAGLVCQQQRAEARVAEQQARETAQLREHAERMAALDKTKSEFLQLASHELRSPIGVVRGYLSMLEDGTIGAADLPRVLPILMAKTQQTNLLINEMLETARLEARSVDLKLRPVDLRDVARESVLTIRPLLGADSAIELILPDEPVPVLADPARLETVVSNLLDNAVKYSPGNPQVSCAVSISNRHATIDVRDHGIGIDARHLPQLFQRFSRVATNVTASIPGTGLGLYIARELVRQQGGDITVSSTPGAGSRFTVSLPLVAG